MFFSYPWNKKHTHLSQKTYTLSMISKDRYTHLGTTFCSCCFYRFERHFRKTKKGCSIPPISHKNYWGSLYCHEKVLKKVRLAQRYPEFPLPPGSMLSQVWKSCVRQWWSGMTKQTCDQHWIRRQGSHYFCDWLSVCCECSLHHCVKSVQIRSFFWSEYRKIRSRKNSVFAHFSRSASLEKRRTNKYCLWKLI